MTVPVLNRARTQKNDALELKASRWNIYLFTVSITVLRSIRGKTCKPNFLTRLDYHMVVYTADDDGLALQFASKQMPVTV